MKSKIIILAALIISTTSCKKEYIKPTPEADKHYSASEITTNIVGLWVYDSDTIYSTGGFSFWHPNDTVNITSTEYQADYGGMEIAEGNSNILITDTQIHFLNWGDIYKVIRLDATELLLYNETKSKMRHYSKL
jgi:hypothetical protein